MHFVVGIAGKENGHLEILSKIAIIFSDEDEVQKLLDAGSVDETVRSPRGCERVVKAVHFGAGNIGRGFVGLILHNAGYEVVFADVAADLIDALATTPSYQVKEVGETPRTWTVDNYRALNSGTDEAAVVEEIATAEIVTTAVGPNILRFVAPVIAAALPRATGSAPLTVMACENANRATDLLRTEVRRHGGDDAARGTRLEASAVFANTAVDRIVPGQPEGAGLDVTVEDFFEWAIESGPFGDVTTRDP